MHDSSSKGISYTAGFFMLIGFAIAGILLAYYISVPIWTNMTGESVKDMEAGMRNPANSDAVKVLQCIQAVIGFLMPALLTASLLSYKPMKLLGFKGQIHTRQVLLVFGVLFTALFVSGFFSYLNEMIPVPASWKIRFDRLEKEYNKLVETVVGLNNIWEYLLGLVIMGFLPALCEEVLFRGGFQNFLTRATRMPWLSIFIVSILFSLAHFSFYGFLSRFFLGVVLGLLYQYSGRIWLTILAHFLNNAIVLTSLYILKLRGKSLEEAMSADPSWKGIFALPFLLILLYYFSKLSVPGKESTEELSATAQENPQHGI